MTGIRSGTQILPQTGMMTPAGMFVPPNGYTPMMIFREEPVKLGDGVRDQSMHCQTQSLKCIIYF